MGRRHDKRSSELQRKLAAHYNLQESTVNLGVAALLESIRGRLPLGVEVCLASWMPESWQLVSQSKRRGVVPRDLEAEEIRAAVVEAGIPDHYADEFIASVFQFIESRLSRPLVSAIRRRIPELQAFETDAVGPAAGR